MDDFLMGAVASNEEFGAEFCRIILSVFLDRPVGRVRVVAQRTIPAFTPELRGIRMDVEVAESMGGTEKELPALHIYDIEPHIARDGCLEKRNRFYQAKIDGRNMLGGTKDFSRMPNLYMITITPYDPFGYNYMMYTIQNQCQEVAELAYADGLKFIYLNPRGEKGGTEEIRNLLHYFQDSSEHNVTNGTLEQIHGYVERVKRQPEVEKEYMKFEEIIYYERKEAAEEAARETAEESRRESICDFLAEHGRVPEDLKRNLEKEHRLEVLREWQKLSARVKSIDEFRIRTGV